MLTISDNRHYLLEDGKPFFWLGIPAGLSSATSPRTKLTHILKTGLKKVSM